MTEKNDVELAGPRLAIRVAELIRLAVANSAANQRTIAERMGISESRLSQILHGDGNFHTATLGRLFAAADCTLDLRVFDSAGHEIAIPRRGRQRRTSAGAYYVQSIETSDGDIESVVSYAHQRVEGRPIDLPLRYDNAADARRAIEFEFDFEVEREHADA